MYGAFEQASPRSPKRRSGELTFATLAEAVAHFEGHGAFAEIDPDGNDAADVFTRGGVVLTVERL